METEAEKAEPPHALVSVRRVSRVKKLDTSQTHEVVMVDGWPVVVKKDLFAKDQKVLFFAIDCVLPFGDSRFEPYSSSLFLVELHGQKGLAVQTVKREGHISQGMVFPIDYRFPEITWKFPSTNRKRKRMPTLQENPYLDESQSTKALPWSLASTKGFIRKWSTYYPRDGGRILGSSPSFLPDNKSVRVQDIPELWETHGDTEFQITEILVGMPMIFYDVTECLENVRSQLPGVIINDEAENGVLQRTGRGVSIGGQDYEETEDSICWRAVKEQEIETGVGTGLAGVLCGSRIADNPHKIDGHWFLAYAMCDKNFKTWKTINGRHGDLGGLLDSSEHVPKFAERIRLSTFAEDLDELMKKAQGASCVSQETRDKYPSLKRKGLAFRALDGSISFKVIANDWLLDETQKLRDAGEYGIVRQRDHHEFL